MPLSHMFGFLRFVRGLCGLLFGLNIMGLYAMNTWFLFAVNIVSMVVSGVFFFWLRRYINRTYTAKHGKPHPDLGNRWAL